MSDGPKVINLNDAVSVTLTDRGAAIYRAQYGNGRALKAGDVLKTKLWELMWLFGPHTFMGAPGICFEGNSIEVLE